MFQVAYATAPDERRTESFPTLDEARRRACALLAERGDGLSVDIRMGDTMILIGAVEIRQWCADRAAS